MVKKRRVFDLFVVLVSLVCFHQASCGGPLPTPTPEAEHSTPVPEVSFATATLAVNRGASEDSRWTSLWIKHIIIFGVVACILVGGFFVVRYLRTERKKSFIRRYSRLKTSSRVDQDEEGDDIELSIFEKK